MGHRASSDYHVRRIRPQANTAKPAPYIRAKTLSDIWTTNARRISQTWSGSVSGAPECGVQVIVHRSEQRVDDGQVALQSSHEAGLRVARRQAVKCAIRHRDSRTAFAREVEAGVQHGRRHDRAACHVVDVEPQRRYGSAQRTRHHVSQLSDLQRAVRPAILADHALEPVTSIEEEGGCEDGTQHASSRRDHESPRPSSDPKSHRHISRDCTSRHVGGATSS
jgi:hypothetical protein